MNKYLRPVEGDKWKLEHALARFGIDFFKLHGGHQQVVLTSSLKEAHPLLVHASGFNEARMCDIYFLDKSFMA